MNREIKFRVWDAVNKKIWYHGDKTESGNPIYIALFGEDWAVYDSNTDTRIIRSGYGNELMQFTGLHDKKGNEIYEGDVLQTVHDDGTRLSKFSVYWENKQAAWWKKREDGFGFVCDKKSESFKEILGNVFSNPEILNHE